MVTMDDRKRQLEQLVAALRELVCVLERDPGCRWTPHFMHCLQEADRLLHGGFSQEEINGLSSSVRHVYAGSGSFGDYEPATFDPLTGRCMPIPGTEEFDHWAREVDARADELRVVGRY